MNRAVQLLLAALVLAALAALPGGSARAEGGLCLDNQFEVAWVHPGITFFLDEDGEDGECTGESLVLKEGESGCFSAEAVPQDGSLTLRALDATTAACRTVCPITQSEIEIVFDQSNAYGCR